MKKLLFFLKNHSWIWIIVLVLVAIIGDAILVQKQGKPKATPTPVAHIASFKNITPGVATEAELNKVLGTPTKTIINGDQKTDEYKSSSQFRNHTAIIQNGTVVLIKEIISATDTTKASDITDGYGQAPDVLYENSANSTFHLYVYPGNGIAYLGHSDGTLQEIWYFSPTTIDEFRSLWAPHYLTSPPKEQLQ